MAARVNEEKTIRAKKMLQRNKPRITIGLPVFNGQRYLAQSLDSILAQTYQDFELIISDNASTDNTYSICQEYAAKDGRIRYYRNARNLGVVTNFNRVFMLSSTEYFKWAACDDMIAPCFLSDCVKILDTDPSVVLCHSRTGYIDEQGTLIGQYDSRVRIDSPRPHDRFGDLIFMSNEAWVLIYGLMRSDLLRMTRLLGQYMGSDRNLLAEISLIGRFYETSECMFLRRKHSQSYTDRADFKNYGEKLSWWTGNDELEKTVFPYWKICLEYFNSVERMPLSWIERQRCYAQIVKWLIEEGWIFMGSDIGVNLIGLCRARVFKKKLDPLIEWFFSHSHTRAPHTKTES